MKKELECLIDVDFPDYAITKEARDNSVKASKRGYSTSVRIATGRCFTSEEYEARRQKVLSTPLP